MTRRSNDDESTPADLLKIFGENLRLARTEAGLSQRDLSALTAIPQRIIVAAEAGRQNLTIVTMTRLASAVGKEVPIMLMLARVGPHGKTIRKRKPKK